jgi:hypothetical protein
MSKAYAVITYRSISDAQKLAAYGKLAIPAVAPRIFARGTAPVEFGRISKFGEGNRCP